MVDETRLLAEALQGAPLALLVLQEHLHRVVALPDRPHGQALLAQGQGELQQGRRDAQPGRGVGVGGHRERRE